MSDLFTVMNHKVEVDRVLVTFDDAGAQIQTWENVGVNIPCYIRPMNGNEGKRWGRETVRNGLIAVFRPDMFLLDGRYRVRWPSALTGGYRTFDVQAVSEPGQDETGLPEYIEALLEETV